MHVSASLKMNGEVRLVRVCVWSCGGGVSGWRDLIHHLIPSSSPGKLQPLMQEVINMTH